MTSAIEQTAISQRISKTEDGPTLCESALFLLGSYFIALLISSAVHELGHGLALTSISIGFKLVLNPFSTSMAMPLSPIPHESLLFAVASGMITEVLFGTTVFLALWRWRSPRLAPLLLIGPFSYLSSSGYLLAGNIVPDSDISLILSAGVPLLLIQMLAVALMVLGAFSLFLLFPLLGVSMDDSTLRILIMLFVGMTAHGFGMILFALITNPQEMYIGTANVISMSITVTILSGVYAKVRAAIDRVVHTEVAQLKWRTVFSVLGIAALLIAFEFLFFN
jgi:hypothetical protein